MLLLARETQANVRVAEGFHVPEKIPVRRARGESIVGLFDGADSRATGLTEFDRTFLTTLYAGIPNLPGSSRLAALSDATGYSFPAEE